ncbi:MAG: hypothetical protein L6M37_07215 [Candidatus Methylarchaceae archaeon HK02M1]|nr:hypothetical protein [Candidatus Methylarchaceae archaeon HK02M1]
MSNNILAPITIFGLSTEGYRIASSLSFFDMQTTLVDENLNVGMQLKNKILARFDSVAALLEDEPLLGLESLEDAISKAKCIFFAPKIRTHGIESKSTISLRLKSVAKHLSKGVVFVNMLPMSYGGNRENISLIEKLTGLDLGVGFDYIYAPLTPRTNKPVLIGSSRIDIDEAVIGTLRSAMIDVPDILPLYLAEWLYSKYIIRKYSSIATELELCKKLSKPRDLGLLKGFTDSQGEVYLETVSENLFDIKVITETLKSGEPLWYTMSGILKSLEGYIKYIANRVRAILKEKGLKAGRARILVAWSIDPFEMREDKISTFSNLIEKLHDCVGSVVALDTIPYLQAFYPRLGIKRGLPSYEGKDNLILACSKEDFKIVFENSQTELGVSTIIIKANLPVEVTTASN